MSTSAFASQDGHALLQILLDAPQLAQYYHFEARPERLPLKVVNATAIDFGASALTAVGKPVQVSGARDPDALEITAVDVVEDGASLTFRYPVEGLMGHATFAKVQGRWSLQRIDVAEAK